VGESNRQRLLMLELIDQLKWFGSARNSYTLSDGRVGYLGKSGVFGTLDNTVLIFAIQFGAICALVLVVTMVALVWIGVRRRGLSLSGAVVSQLIAILTVAMITQFAILFWILSGILVSQDMVLTQTTRPDAKWMGRKVETESQRSCQHPASSGILPPDREAAQR
jgi:hypothetical protein